MQYSEAVQMVVGVLTRTMELRRRIEEDPDWDISGEPDLIAQLMGNLFADASFPQGLTHEQLEAMGVQIGDAVGTLAHAFSLVFLELATAHDQGRVDISTADVLRDMAIRAAEGRFD